MRKQATGVAESGPFFPVVVSPSFLSRRQHARSRVRLPLVIIRVSSPVALRLFLLKIRMSSSKKSLMPIMGRKRPGQKKHGSATAGNRSKHARSKSESGDDGEIMEYREGRKQEGGGECETVTCKYVVRERSDATNRKGDGKDERNELDENEQKEGKNMKRQRKTPRVSREINDVKDGEETPKGPRVDARYTSSSSSSTLLSHEAVLPWTKGCCAAVNSNSTCEWRTGIQGMGRRDKTIRSANSILCATCKRMKVSPLRMRETTGEYMSSFSQWLWFKMDKDRIGVLFEDEAVIPTFKWLHPFYPVQNNLDFRDGEGLVTIARCSCNSIRLRNPHPRSIGWRNKRHGCCGGFLGRSSKMLHVVTLVFFFLSSVHSYWESRGAKGGEEEDCTRTQQSRGYSTPDG